MSELVRITRATAIIGAATLLSRILGFVRDMVIAWVLGAGLVSDAFLAAFRLPDLMRRLFVEGAFSMAFVPVFSERLAVEGRVSALKLASSAGRMLAVVLIGTVIVGILAAPALVQILAPGFSTRPAQFDMAVSLVRIMLPYVFFIGMTALFAAVLNGFGHFAAPAFSPLILNVSVICFALSTVFAPDSPAFLMALGVLFGGLFQMLLQFPFLINRRAFSLSSFGTWADPGIKKIRHRLIPSIFGASAYQINLVLGTLLASFSGMGGISYLYYADRLIQFPLGIFAVSASTALLPGLCRQACLKQSDQMLEDFEKTLGLIFFLTLPAMMGIIVLRQPMVDLLFCHGAFDIQSSRLTANALLYYGMGLWAIAGTRVLTPVFYALGEIRIPVRSSAISICVYGVLGASLMTFMGYSGLALAASVAAAANFGLLVRRMPRDRLEWRWKNLRDSFLMSFTLSSIMGLGVWLISRELIPHRTGWPLAAGLFGCISAGILIYGALSIVCLRSEMKWVWALFESRGKR